MPKSIAQFSPPRVIIASILLTIVVATILLSLPFAQTKPVSLLDTLFVSTSSICVCGLTTVPLLNFSFIGHCIILVLMQIGGLSLVTLTLFLMSIFMQFGFRTQLIAGQLLELELWQNFKKILIFTIGLTLISELIGAALIFISIYDYYSLSKAIFYSVFHAVSVFCHCGITLFPENMYSLSGNYLFLITSILLIFIGGFGFLVWHDLYLYYKTRNERKQHRLSLHSRVVIIMTIVMYSSSIALFWLLEHQTTLAHFPPVAALLNAILNGVSMRGTGLVTIPLPELQLATILVFMVVCFIGDSPGSTGSGIKTTTVALIFATIRAALSGRSSPTLRHRSLVKAQIHRAIAIFFLSACWIIFVCFCLLITEKGFSFLSIFFESVSAFGNLGLTTGLTPLLSFSGKLFVIVTMVVGRIGPVSILLAMQKKHDVVEFTYPEERVMLG